MPSTHSPRGWKNRKWLADISRSVDSGQPSGFLLIADQLIVEQAMRIDGSYTFDAPRDLLWSLLHDFPTIQQAIPGCDHFHLHADGKYHLSLTLPAGPFAGYYEGLVTRIEEQPQESLKLSVTGSGPELVLFGEGVLLLEENHEQTVLIYKGDVEVSGQIPSHSPRLTRTTVNFLIRNFMEGLDQQVRRIAGNGRSPQETAVVERTTPTIGMQDFLAELRRDRRVAVAVLILALLAVLSFLGAVFSGILAMRWLTRFIAGRASQPAGDSHGDELLTSED